MTRSSPPRSKTSWRIEPGQPIAPGRVAQALLGGGERFEVYAAWNERLLAPTVLKVLRPEFAGDERARRQMAREGNLLAGLQHPGLTRVFGLHVDGERPYVELEHIEGPRLSTLIRRHGRLNPEQAFPLARQVAATLAFLHGEGYLHLDVKPSNIIMGPTPMLVDLSVARRFERAQFVSGYVGTDAYMSPEQADPALWAAIGPGSDTWGLGATLYHAIAKRPPHASGRHDGEGAARFPQLAQDPEPLETSRHGRPLVELIMEMLARRPEARPTPTELFERFDELAERAGVGKVRFR